MIKYARENSNRNQCNVYLKNQVSIDYLKYARENQVAVRKDKVNRNIVLIYKRNVFSIITF